MEFSGEDVLNHIKRQAMAEYYMSKKLPKYENDHNISVQPEYQMQFAYPPPSKISSLPKTYQTSETLPMNFSVPPPTFISPYKSSPSMSPCISEAFNFQLNKITPQNLFTKKQFQPPIQAPTTEDIEPQPPGTETETTQNIQVINTTKYQKIDKKRTKSNTLIRSAHCNPCNITLPTNEFMLHVQTEYHKIRQKNIKLNMVINQMPKSSYEKKNVEYNKSRIHQIPFMKPYGGAPTHNYGPFQSIQTANDVALCLEKVTESIYSSPDQKAKYGMCVIPGFDDICNNHHSSGEKARICSSYGSGCKFYSAKQLRVKEQDQGYGRGYGMCEVPGFHTICLSHYFHGIKANKCSAIFPARCIMENSNMQAHKSELASAQERNGAFPNPLQDRLESAFWHLPHDMLQAKNCETCSCQLYVVDRQSPTEYSQPFKILLKYFGNRGIMYATESFSNVKNPHNNTKEEVFKYHLEIKDLHQVRCRKVVESPNCKEDLGYIETKRHAALEMLEFLHYMAQKHNGNDIWNCRICLGELTLNGQKPNPVKILDSKYEKFGLRYTCDSIASNYDTHRHYRKDGKMFNYTIEISNLPGRRDLKCNGSGTSSMEAKMDAAIEMLQIIHEDSYNYRLDSSRIQPHTKANLVKEEKRLFFERIKHKNTRYNEAVSCKRIRDISEQCKAMPYINEDISNATEVAVSNSSSERSGLQIENREDEENSFISLSSEDEVSVDKTDESTENKIMIKNLNENEDLGTTSALPFGKQSSLTDFVSRPKNQKKFDNIKLVEKIICEIVQNCCNNTKLKSNHYSKSSDQIDAKKRKLEDKNNEAVEPNFHKSINNNNLSAGENKSRKVKRKPISWP